MEATGIVKGTKNLELAKKVADWGASKAASELYSKYYAIVADPSVENIPPNYPADRREGDDQERLRLDGGEPRPHPGRMVEALRVKGRAEELTKARHHRAGALAP